MATRHHIASPAGTVMLCITLVLLASSCAQSTPSSRPAATQAGAGAPVGGPVPAQVQGDWHLPAAAANAYVGGACPTPLSTATCMFKLTFTATTFKVVSNVAGYTGGEGNVVVNGTEMDFFNGSACGIQLPGGVGRYIWTLSGATLRFALVADPCPTRYPFLSDQSFVR